jgi:hypothetical protein
VIVNCAVRLPVSLFVTMPISSIVVRTLWRDSLTVIGVSSSAVIEHRAAHRTLIVSPPVRNELSVWYAEDCTSVPRQPQWRVALRTRSSPPPPRRRAIRNSPTPLPDP